MSLGCKNELSKIVIMKLVVVVIISILARVIITFYLLHHRSNAFLSAKLLAVNCCILVVFPDASVLLQNILDPLSVDKDRIRVAIVTFSSAAVTEFNGLEDDATANGVTRCSVYRQLRNLIDVRLYGNAATYAALSEARKLLLNTREIARKAVLLITDSFPNVGEHPRKMSLQIQTLSWSWNWSSTDFGPQVEVYAFGIASADTEFLESVASDLPKHFSHFPNFFAFDHFTESIRAGSKKKSVVIMF